MKKTNERKVTVHRKMSFAAEAQKDPEVKSYFGMGFLGLGPYFKKFGQETGTGLTQREEEFLLPMMLGVPHTHPDYLTRKKKFYDEHLLRVPQEGVTLEIGLEEEGKPLIYDEDVFEETVDDKGATKMKKIGTRKILNKPLNIKEYIAYRHALEHPKCAESFKQSQMHQHYIAYIEDSYEIEQQNVELMKLSDEANTFYHNIKSDPLKMSYILEEHGYNSDHYTKDQALLKFRELSFPDQELSPEIQKEKLVRFLKICNDKNLKIKFEINKMISAGVLERHGMRIVNTESGEEIGSTIDGAVLWLKDKGNSKEYNILKAKLKELSKSEHVQNNF